MIQRDFQLRRLRLGVVLSAFLWLAAGAAGAGSVIWQQKDDFVRLDAEPGVAANPAAKRLPVLSPDAVRSVLAAIKLTSDGSTSEFLTDEQIALIAEPISRALKQAGPGEDVAFAVHYAAGVLSRLGPPRMTAGRLYLDADAVGVIIGMVQETYLRNIVTVDSSLIRTGSRQAPQQTEWRIQPNGFVSLAQAGRGDWARISPAVWLGSYEMQAAAPATAPAAMAAPAEMPAAAPAAPMPAAIAAPPPPPPGIEERFAILKRLYETHMITEAEYDKSKAALLEGLTGLSPR